MTKLDLPNITLCAASDVATVTTLHSLRRCMELATFKRVVFFTSKFEDLYDVEDVEICRIASLSSRDAYGEFILRDLSEHIDTDFALIVQWDGFIITPEAWSPDFLDFDYIGAPWADFSPPMNVGNGGFSLRSKRLLDAGSQPWFEISHPEDLCICHKNRGALEERGLRIADASIAQRFSRERTSTAYPYFGAHGIFVLAEIMDHEQFEALLRSIEFGVIGKRELIDTLKVLTRNRRRNRYSIKRCASELIRRYPFDRKSLLMLRHLIT